MSRQYTAAERTAAVALASAIGPVKASEKLGIPRRTVAYWMHLPAASPIIAAAEQDIADELRKAHALALAEVMAGLRDPKARLGDKAQALRIVGEQLALAEGRATSHNLNVNVDQTAALTDEEARQLRDWLEAVDNATDEELREAAPSLRGQMLEVNDA